MGKCFGKGNAGQRHNNMEAMEEGENKVKESDVEVSYKGLSTAN